MKISRARILGKQSRNDGIFYMQTETEDTGQDLQCGCTPDQIQHVLSVFMKKCRLLTGYSFLNFRSRSAFFRRGFTSARIPSTQQGSSLGTAMD